MKLTKSKLKQIILEEIQKVLKEQPSGERELARIRQAAEGIPPFMAVPDYTSDQGWGTPAPVYTGDPLWGTDPGTYQGYTAPAEQWDPVGELPGAYMPPHPYAELGEYRDDPLAQAHSDAYMSAKRAHQFTPHMEEPDPNMTTRELEGIRDMYNFEYEDKMGGGA